jgi:hypothetical protein
MSKGKVGSYDLRKAVLANYNNACAACGCADTESLECDHAVSRKDGGTNDPSNLQILCGVCNKVKGDFSMERLSPRKPLYDCRDWTRGRIAFRKFMNERRRG